MPVLLAGIFTLLRFSHTDSVLNLFYLLEIARRRGQGLGVMLAKVFSYVVFGVDSFQVEVEVDVPGGQKEIFNGVGLSDAAVKESKDHVKAALINSGFYYLREHITVNLTPADLRKEGGTLETSMGSFISFTGFV